MLAVGAPGGKPDLGVRSWRSGEASRVVASAPSGEGDAPDVEVSVSAIDPGTALLIEHHGALVAAVELVSPRNEDWPTARESDLSRYVGYLLGGANLVLIDVHARPLGFSFADRIAEALGLEPQLPCPPPAATAYRVGEPAATGGRMLAIWRRPFAVGAPLPSIPLPLAVGLSVPLDLEPAYARAAEDSYLS